MSADTPPAPGLHLAGRAAFGPVALFGPLTLDLPGGRWSCLLGPSGCGKSTILRLIAGLATGVDFDGTIRAADGGPVAPRVAYMAQTDLLLPWRDVLGNVTLGASLRGQRPDPERARALIARLGLEGAAHRRPAQLSGGQRQRVALARTLMEDRAFVLLDEPFSALDARTRAEMQELAAETLEGRTVLLVTHDPAEAARMGAEVLMMEGGAIHRQSPPPLPPIRPADDPATLAFGAALLGRLRA